MRLKIIFTIPNLGVGGAEKFLINLVNNLNTKKYEIYVVSFSDLNPLECQLNSNLSLKVISRKAKFDFRHLIELKKYYTEIAPDLIFNVGFFSFFLSQLTIKLRREHIQSIISYHTTEHRNRKEDLLMRFFLLFLKKDDFIIGVSRKQMIYTRNRYSLNSNQLLSIYNGIDTSFWKYPNTNEDFIRIRKELGIPYYAEVIIMTATFRSEKNHKGAIDALELLYSKGKTDVYLVFVGAGILFNEINSYAKSTIVGSRIIFTGNQMDVRPYYYASNLFTLTSRNVETFSIAALEALCCGLPCVLTNIGGAEEMIKDGENGYLSGESAEEISSSWLKALDIEFDQKTISRIAQEKYSTENMVSQYEQIIDLVSLNGVS
jgi:glycosyltransferase involved in cell wall biosynthesis